MSSQCVASASVVPIIMHPRAGQTTLSGTASTDSAGPGPTTGMRSGTKVSVTGGGIDAKAAVADPGSGANSAPPVLMACSDALHKGMAVVISVGVGTSTVVVVVGMDAVQVMRDAGLVCTATEVTVSAADVDETTAGEDDIRGINEFMSISRELENLCHWFLQSLSESTALACWDWPRPPGRFTRSREGWSYHPP